jgi:hypothetical protein
MGAMSIKEEIANKGLANNPRGSFWDENWNSYLCI